MYLEADLATKGRALGRLQPPRTSTAWRVGQRVLPGSFVVIVYMLEYFRSMTLRQTSKRHREGSTPMTTWTLTPKPFALAAVIGFAAVPAHAQSASDRGFEQRYHDANPNSLTPLPPLTPLPEVGQSEYQSGSTPARDKDSRTGAKTTTGNITMVRKILNTTTGRYRSTASSPTYPAAAVWSLPSMILKRVSKIFY